MTDRIRCFLLEPTGKVRHGLRRYAFMQACPEAPGRPNLTDGPCLSYHNAETVLCVMTPQNDGDRTSGDYWAHDDPKWPKTCARCGYEFQDGDYWQRTAWPVYARPTDGQLFTLHDAPVGAMWWADWLAGHHESPKHKARGGGPHLIVKTPAGDWDIDAPSSNGDGWDRTGTPPVVTCTPSIGMPGAQGHPYAYHGFLTAGELIEC